MGFVIVNVLFCVVIMAMGGFPYCKLNLQGDCKVDGYSKPGPRCPAYRSGEEG